MYLSLFLCNLLFEGHVAYSCLAESLSCSVHEHLLLIFKTC